MDFLALYLTSRLCNFRTHTLRLAMAALTGALFALTATVVSIYKGTVNPICIIIFMILTATVISTIAFGITECLRTAITYAAVNMGLGGCMTALSNIAAKLQITSSEDMSTTNSGELPSLMFFIIAIISGAVSIIYTAIRKKYTGRKTVKVKMSAFGFNGSFTLLCDSGNLLFDPFCKKPVLILSREHFRDRLPEELLDASRDPEKSTELPIKFASKIRLIPAGGVLGKGLLLGFIPDKLEIEGAKADAVVAIGVQDNEYGGCAGIIPSTLIT